MKKRVLLSVLAITVLFSLVGCTSTSMSMPAQQVPLEKAEYEILGDTQAEANGIVVLGMVIGGRKMGSLWNPAAPFAFKSLSPVERVKASALYKTLKQMPEADEVIYPRWEIESFRIPYLFERHKVVCTAKGIRLKEGMVEKVSSSD